MPDEKPVCIGLVERIGSKNAVITHTIYLNGEEKVVHRTLELPGHEAGLQEVAQLLTGAETGVIKNPEEINAVGHRVVHGGESFSSTTVITERVKEEIKKLFSLAPLHNPANYLGIEVAEKIFTKAVQVAVFDTAFHQTLHEVAYRYAIPQSFYTDFGIRAYGFHGTSHKYVTAKSLAFLQNKEAKIITIHLGNGCSMTAVNAGVSMDTSMGFGPLSGLVMGTRSGDIDPSIIFHLVNQAGFSLEQVNEMLNKKSGMLGLTGFSDMRDIQKEIAVGNKDAALAYEIYTYRIKKYIGAYTAVMNGLDAVVFTAGVGENDAATRRMVCTGMDYLGIQLDDLKNEGQDRKLRDISREDAPVRILVVPTNEELEIVQQCYTLLRKEATGSGSLAN